MAITTVRVDGGEEEVVIERNGEAIRLKFGVVCAAAAMLREHVLLMLPPENLPTWLLEEAAHHRARAAEFTFPTEQEKALARELVEKKGPLHEATLAQALADARVRTVRG